MGRVTCLSALFFGCCVGVRSLVVVLAILCGTSIQAALAQEMTDGRKLPRPWISEGSPLAGHDTEVNGAKIHWVEQGEGDPIVFIHGNPTSSYLWRNVTPLVANQGRAIALDLVGMGRSDKLKGDYGYEEHYAYLEGFIDALHLKNITFVLHEWGAALGFDYASRHPERVKRIAFMEGILPPIFSASGFDVLGGIAGPQLEEFFRGMKEDKQMIVDQNLLIDVNLPNLTNRQLGPEAMEEYRRPYASTKDRAVLLAWLRDIPIDGEPAGVAGRVLAIEQFMKMTDLPVLLLYSEPGVLVSPRLVPWYVHNMHNVETAYVGEGLHFIPEDEPVAIGRAISDWIRRN